MSWRIWLTAGSLIVASVVGLLGMGYIVERIEESLGERCLRSVAPHVSSYAICDTGSTDGTPPAP